VFCVYAWVHPRDDTYRCTISVHDAEVEDVSSPETWRIRFPARGIFEVDHAEEEFVNGFPALVAGALTDGLIPLDLSVPREELLMALLRFVIL
jgi:hypothetical protein